MEDKKYAVRMLRAATLIARTDSGQEFVEIPKLDEKGNNSVVHVRLDVAREWVDKHVAEAVDALPE